MVCSQLRITSISELRNYVNETLCGQNYLKKDAFYLSERLLKRGGKPCGIFYCLHGPRKVKFTAIWEVEKNQIFFYSPSGERVQQTQLLEDASGEQTLGLHELNREVLGC